MKTYLAIFLETNNSHFGNYDSYTNHETTRILHLPPHLNDLQVTEHFCAMEVPTETRDHNTASEHTYTLTLKSIHLLQRSLL